MYERTCSFVLVFLPILISAQSSYMIAAPPDAVPSPATFDIKLAKHVCKREFMLDRRAGWIDWRMISSLVPNEVAIQNEVKHLKENNLLQDFSVDIETAKGITLGDPVKITVRSKYSSGEPVKGEARILISDSYYQSIAIKCIDLDGSAHVELEDFHLIGVILSERLIPSELRILVEVEPIILDEYTGIMQSKTAVIKLQRSDYNFDIPNYVYKHVVNDPFELKVFVKNRDGSPVQDNKHIAKFFILTNNSQSKSIANEVLVFTSEVDRNGMALFNCTLPTAGNYFTLVTYAGAIKDLPIKLRAENFYFIVAPNTIQPQLNYSVIVSLHNNSEPARFKVGIAGPSYNETKTIDITPSQTKVVHFELPKLQNGNYRLGVEGVKGFTFKSYRALFFKYRGPKVYIQTDKAAYKPDDLVQYRVIVLDEDTRPAKLETPLRLTFKDGADNFIKQINDIKLTKGVYCGEFQLSEQSILGEWTMEFSLGPNEDDTKTVKKFEVEKYVLPKFSVDIETAKDIVHGDPVKITVRSKYTYGKPVKGQAVVKVSDLSSGLEAAKVIDVDGKGHAEFAMSRERVTAKNQIIVLVTMTEELTGNKQSKAASINLHESRYNIRINNYVHEYFAKKPFELKVFLNNLDGSPVQPSKEMVKLIMNAYRNEGHVFTSTVDKNGMALFKVNLTTAENDYIVMVKYADQFVYLPNLRGREEKDAVIKDKPKARPEYETLTLVQKTKKLNLDEDVVIEVKSNRSIPYYIYGIVARGNIIKQDYVKLPENVKSDEIKFKPSFKMVPESHVYAYYVIEGDLKFHEITLNFPKQFQNKIEITAPKQAKPSEEVTLNIKTDPESFVGLLGVDQSVRLQKSGNVFDASQILNGLKSYDTVKDSGLNYPGRQSGLVTFTNADYPHYEHGIPHDDVTDVRNEPPSIPKHFGETWIFNNINNTDANGLASLTKKIPDTINSWVVTGFSLNEKTGIGMVAKPTNIEIFKPFFVSTNLPYSVKRGEVIAIPVVVFNYMDKNLDAEVTMENTDDEYDFIEVSNEIEELVLEEKQRVKRVSVASNSVESVLFMIRPNKVGEITLKIKAITPLAGDAIHKTLKVEPEGDTQYVNQVVFIAPSATKEPIVETLKALIPKEAVLDSEYMELSVVGDILGPTMINIDKFVVEPDGSGEGGMMSFAHNILVLQYLDAIKRELPTVTQKAKKFMELGYQHELIFKHKNGAFSDLGESRTEANTWLTAYVARSFIQAKRFITIDQAVIDDALKYLLSNQLESGQFNATRFYPSHQDVGFTAFALLAFLEDVEISNKYKTEIEKGIKYLAENLDKVDNNHALAVTARVLKKVQHPSAGKLLKKLQKLAQDYDWLKWWTTSSNDTSNDDEMMACILEDYVFRESAEKVLPIINWLIKNRSDDSTLLTVAVLKTLIRFAEKYSAGDGKMTIKFEAQDGEGKETTKGTFSVDKENSLLLQSHVLPKSSRQITMEADGGSSCLVQLSYRYSLATKGDKPGFSVKHTIIETPFPSLLAMKVCVDYVPAADTYIKVSNKAIMEVYLPSGYTAETDKLDNKRNAQHRVDTSNNNTVIIVNFDYIVAGEEECVKVKLLKTHAVAKQQPAAIVVYDYYNPDRRATVYYEVKSSLYDICEDGECVKGSELKEHKKVE